jgi:hypothetical protein
VTDNYTRIVQGNLKRLYANLPEDLAHNLPGEQRGQQFSFKAFGEKCVIDPSGVTFDGRGDNAVMSILITLYALHAGPDSCVVMPFRSIKEIPNSMPYVGAFTTHTEQPLVGQVDHLRASLAKIMATLDGETASPETGGDFAFIVYPLPKIALCYIVYEADDDFPASVKCLFSNNADRFLPVDGLADVGEYASKTIMALIQG